MSSLSPDQIAAGFTSAALAARVPQPKDDLLGFQDGSELRLLNSAAIAPVQLSVKGPTLIRCDSIGGAVAGTTATSDIGENRVWAHEANQSAREQFAISTVGNYLYLPRRGKYFIYWFNEGDGSPVGSMKCTVFQDVDPAWALALLQGTYISDCEFTRTSILLGATSAVINAQLQYLAGPVNYARLLRLDEVLLHNSGAGAALVQLGASAVGGGTGIPLAAGATLTLSGKLVTMRQVLVTAVANTTIDAHASFRY